jgi:hypothetical protein
MAYFKYQHIGCNRLLLDSIRIHQDGKTKPNPAIDPNDYATILELINPYKVHFHFVDDPQAQFGFMLYKNARFLICNDYVAKAVCDKIFQIIGFDLYSTLSEYFECDYCVFKSFFHVSSIDEIKYVLHWTDKPKVKGPKPNRQVKKTSAAQIKTEHFQLAQHECINRLKKLDCSKTICSFDVEAFELDHTSITELGISIWKDNTIQSHHFIISENLDKRNGKYVKDNKDNFLFGTSTVINKDEAFNHLVNLINDCDIIVGQNIKCDFKYLAQNNYHVVTDDKIVFDTQFLNYVHDIPSTLSLSKLCKLSNIEATHPHNAGNDSHYCLQLILKTIERVEQL